MSKVVITGGSGFIGSYLARTLVDKGDSVVVLDNFLRGIPTRLKSVADKINLYNLDLRSNSATLDEVVSEADYLYHLAAVNGTENFYTHSDLVLDVGVKGILNVLDSVERTGGKRLIVASSAEVYQSALEVPTPETVPLLVPDPYEARYSYASSKIISEQLTLAYLRSNRITNAIIFRPHNVYGPDMGFKHVIPQFVKRGLNIKKTGFKDRFTIYGDGSETRAFCYIDDIVEGLQLLQEKGQSGEIYHLGNDEEIQINQLFNLLNSYFDNKLLPEYGESVSGSTRRRCPDITKMRSLGYKPKVNLKSGFDKTFNYYANLDEGDYHNSLL